MEQKNSGWRRGNFSLEATPRDFSALTQGNDYIFKKFRADAELAAAAAKAPDGQPLLLGAPAADCGAALFSLEVTR